MSLDHLRGAGRGKRNLPHPYNLDLSDVLRHLNRRTSLGRTRLANDPLTASFLCAGMRLIDQHLGPGRRCECATRHDGRSLLSFVSQRNIVGALAGVDESFPRPRRGAMSALRDRWAVHAHYVADLVSFAFWRENYRPGYRDDLQERAARLVRGPHLVEAVLEVAYLHTAESVQLPSVRLSLALMASDEGDPDIAQAIAEAYSDYLGSWKALYIDVMQARGLRLRAGLTLDQLADALSAATDGVVLRALGDPAAGVLDHEHRRSLMGSLALAILNAFLQRDDDPEDLTLEQLTARRLSP